MGVIPLMHGGTQRHEKSFIAVHRACDVAHFGELGHSRIQTRTPGVKYGQYTPGTGPFSPGKNRLVMPGVAPGAMPAKSKEKDKSGEGQHHHGGNGGGPQDTLIQALIEKLPPAGPWSADERVNWLKLLTMAFQIAYGQVEEIEIKKPA
jgi:hypothetical protein